MYKMGDNSDSTFRELRDVLQGMRNAAHSGDSRVFRIKYEVLQKFLARNGFGTPTGEDISSPLNWGNSAVKGAGDALRQFAAKVRDGRQLILKANDPGAAARIGEELDLASSAALLKTAEDMSSSGKVSMSDAIMSLAKSSPSMWEAHSRATSGQSRPYWAYVWGIRGKTDE